MDLTRRVFAYASVRGAVATTLTKNSFLPYLKCDFASNEGFTMKYAEKHIQQGSANSLFANLRDPSGLFSDLTLPYSNGVEISSFLLKEDRDLYS